MRTARTSVRPFTETIMQNEQLTLTNELPRPRQCRSLKQWSPAAARVAYTN